jgi:hypothetical protein
MPDPQHISESLRAAEEMIRSSTLIRDDGGAPVSRVACEVTPDGSIGCEFVFENGRVGSGVFSDDLKEGAWFVGDAPTAS